MSLTIRPLRPGEYPLQHRVFALALAVATFPDDELEQRADSFYPELCVGAFDGDDLVGTAGGFPFETAVPGGALLPTLGVTRVGVLPSHRRRGVLRAMMTEQLRGAAARGDVLASLRASQSLIYGRFGYGLAGSSISWHITPSRSAFRRPPAIGGEIRILPRDEWLTVLPAVHERAERRPGWIRRPPWVWDRIAGRFAGPGPRWVAVHRDSSGTPDGSVMWEPVDRDRWEEAGHVMQLTELWAVDDAVEAALLRFALDLDLVDTLRSNWRPPDEPLRWLLADPRALEVDELFDEQWVRLVDVRAALAARSYAGDDHVVLEVADPLLPANSGRYRIGGDGAARVRSRPDLRLDIGELGAVYLGGTRVTDLVRAGHVEELRPGAASRADRLLFVSPSPWCGTFF